jgi:hypothetical protein
MFRFNKKIILGISLGIFLLFSFGVFFFWERTCGDGTPYEQCSKNAPFFCERGELIPKASVCGCPEFFEVQGDSCFSNYSSNSKEIFLEYILNGKKQKMGFMVYDGVLEYVSNLSSSITYYGKNASRLDFKLKNIEEPIQREFLLPLVIQIQNLNLRKIDQLRVAVSLVQNIPYGDEENISSSIRGDLEVNRSFYPYEVLYYQKGVCEGKSELLSFLLKELGYSVGIFYYPV